MAMIHGKTNVLGNINVVRGVVMGSKSLGCVVAKTTTSTVPSYPCTPMQSFAPVDANRRPRLMHAGRTAGVDAAKRTGRSDDCLGGTASRSSAVTAGQARGALGSGNLWCNQRQQVLERWLLQRVSILRLDLEKRMESKKPFGLVAGGNALSASTWRSRHGSCS